ncbi:hypothetical protein PPL_02018 [Heterostelium album PN500]|uniref:Uncharacterized protein n=1 Tax=Heterostelium pallidum (strain ATCC 26659 / Pp 5 / PN500) TaxID=670386 RepID=D3B148_HETP5|nr:hypothetical protein PPL_02018 [Heterostelium album PN500]EFA85022.1 hypothetical protein PPL_02018 [Heterostelium album PN500]|eukprot:XP_020437132.1 hypothetical protein PPL_02018 [Heterostelium album PN500]
MKKPDLSKKSKCQMFQTKVELLGFKIGNGKTFAQSNKIDAIVSFPLPTTVKNLKRFLGLTNYYRNRVPNYARIAAPLYDRTKEKGTIED